MKKIVATAVVFIILISFPMSRFSAMLTRVPFAGDSEEQGVSFIGELEKADKDEAQRAVSLAEESRNYVPKTDKELSKELLKKLEKGKITYKKALSKVYFMGDSLIEGLKSYEILSGKKIISQVSASLYHLEENIELLKKKKPKTVVLHYGVNTLGNDKDSLEGFREFYTKCIKKLKKELPDTRIIVSSIFPVDREIATAKHFSRIGAYNKTIKKMCKELKVDYLNNNPLFKDMEYLYGRDGIHFPEKFYRDYWLKYLIEEMEITG